MTNSPEMQTLDKGLEFKNRLLKAKELLNRLKYIESVGVQSAIFQSNQTIEIILEDDAVPSGLILILAINALEKEIEIIQKEFSEWARTN